MIDQLLSRGLIAYVGTPVRSDWKLAEDRVVEVAGDAAPELLPRIKAIWDELHATKPPLWQAPTLAEVGRRAEAWLKAHHPELSDEAVTAACNQFTYEWR